MKYIGKINFDNRNYDCREINSKFGCVTVASLGLCNALFDNECRFINEEAEKIDEMVFFYVPNEVLKSEEKSINKYLEDNII
jgi:hypothetical protein